MMFCLFVKSCQFMTAFIALDFWDWLQNSKRFDFSEVLSVLLLILTGTTAHGFHINVILSAPFN